MTAPDSLPLHALVEDNLAAASPDLLRAMVKTFADALMSAEADALCNAEYGQVAAFRNRPLGRGPYAFVWVDALTQKVREGGRIINVHALIAVGVNADNAIGATLPGVSWQRCRTHYARALLSQVPKSAQPMGGHAAADRLRTARHRRREGPDAPRPGRPGRQVPQSISPLGHRPARSPGVHRVPARDLAADLVQQPAGAPEQGDPPPHRRGRHLPRPYRPDPPGRRGAGRAERRVDEGRRYMGLDLLAKTRLHPIESQTDETVVPTELTA
jgi:hypothetical protein